MASFRSTIRPGLLWLIACIAASLLFAASAFAQSANKPNPTATVTVPDRDKDKDAEAGDADRDDPLGRLNWQIQEFGTNNAEYKRHIVNETKKHNQRLGRGTGRFGAVTTQDNAGGSFTSSGFSMLNPATGSGPVWTSIGPFGADFEQNGSTTYYQRDSGRLQAVLAHPTDGNTVYVLAATGGLWVTHNFESPVVSWQPLTDFLPTTGGGSVAFGRTPSTLYLGLGDPFDQITVGGSMTKSTDGGATWSQMIDLGNAISIRDVKVDTSTDNDVVLVAADNGIWRSTDNGQTYSQVLNQYAWSIVRTSAGWLAETQNCAVGARWCAGNGSVYLSTDLGATWTLSMTGLTNFGRGMLGVGLPGDAVVYLFAALPNGTVTPGQRDLFKSTDGGANWTALGITTKAPTNPNSNNRDMNLMHVQAWYNQMILVDPTDANRNTVFLGGDLSTARTTDGGATWTLLSNWISGLPYVHADCHAAFFKTAGTPMVLFGTDGGIFASTDGGNTWTSDKNNNLTTHQFYALTGNPAFPNFVMGGLQDNGTRARVGQTGTFNQINGGDGFGVALSQANTETSFVSVYNLALRRGRSHLPPQSYTEMESSLGSRSDGGFYTPIIAPAPGADPSGKQFFTYSAVSGVTNYIYYTPDGGMLWYLLAGTGGLNSKGTANGLPSGTVFRDDPFDFSTSPTDICRMAIGANGGRVFISTDCGDNWTQAGLTAGPPQNPTGWPGFISNVNWADDNTLWVTSVSQAEGLQGGVRTIRVVKSTDRGATFADASNGLPDVPVTRVLVDPRDTTHNTVYAATHVGVYRTTDGGANWAPYGTGLPNVRVNDMYMPPDGGYLRIATYGRGIWELGQLEFTSAAITDDGNTCDHNGVLGNGETGHLTVTLKNVGSAAVNGAVATFFSDNPHLSFPGGNTVTIPNADGHSDVSVSIPVALNGASGIEQGNITVSFGDAPASFTFPQRFNYDLAPATSASDSFEVADGVWTATGPALTSSNMGNLFNWERREFSPVAHAMGVFASNGASENVLTSPVLHAGAGPVSFTFKHRHTLQVASSNATTHAATWADGAVVEFSVDGGPWTDVAPYLDATTPYIGYNYATVSGASVWTYFSGPINQSSNPLNGRSSFGAKNKSFPNYDTVLVNFGTNFADKNIQVRFRLGTNSSSGTQGWEIDDVAFTGVTTAPFTAMVPHNEACATGLALTSSPNPVVFGNSVAFAASVNGGVTPATGTITLKEGDTVLGSAAAVDSQALINVSGLSVGSHSVTASFDGDAGHAASTSGAYAQVVTDFGMSADPVIIDRSGMPAVFNVTLNSVNGFAGVVNLACSNLPQYATCSMSPVNVNGASATFTVTINVLQNTGNAKGQKFNKTMPGTYNVTLTGTNSGQSRTTTLTFSIQ